MTKCSKENAHQIRGAAGRDVTKGAAVKEVQGALRAALHVLSLRREQEEHILRGEGERGQTLSEEGETHKTTKRRSRQCERC